MTSEMIPRYDELQHIVSQNLVEAKVYAAINSNEMVKYRRSKIMFVGQGGAGKTSTIRSLLGEEFQKESLLVSVLG